VQRLLKSQQKEQKRGKLWNSTKGESRYIQRWGGGQPRGGLGVQGIRGKKRIKESGEKSPQGGFKNSLCVRGSGGRVKKQFEVKSRAGLTKIHKPGGGVGREEYKFINILGSQKSKGNFLDFNAAEATGRGGGVA